MCNNAVNFVVMCICLDYTGCFDNIMYSIYVYIYTQNIIQDVHE